MFHIKDITAEHCIELACEKQNAYAKINLALGASVQDLILEGKEIIKQNAVPHYNKSYASAILFPFPNRMKHGSYTFNNKEYQLPINDTEHQHALHGLVYNKTFNLIKKVTSSNTASVILQYEADGTQKGFPFKYKLEVCYTLNNKELFIEVSAKNTDNVPFPFALGWHPYFYTDNLFDSEISFKSDQKAVLTDDLLIKEFRNHQKKESFQIKNHHLDDCYISSDSKIFFKTPSYQIAVKSDAKKNYLQIYTPPNRNSLAIEPLTAPGNSFNNKLGLQTLNPNREYTVCWKIETIE